jgi:hypothetical protein
MLKSAADCVLASLNASTYLKVRLGISLAAALPGDAFEHPAGVGLAKRLSDFATNRRVKRGRTSETIKLVTGHGLLTRV